MRAQIKENIEKYRAKNPGIKIDMKILTEKVFGDRERKNYEIIRRYNSGKAKAYKLEYLFSICRILDCNIQDLVKYES